MSILENEIIASKLSHTWTIRTHKPEVVMNEVIKKMTSNKRHRNDVDEHDRCLLFQKIETNEDGTYSVRMKMKSHFLHIVDMVLYKISTLKENETSEKQKINKNTSKIVHQKVIVVHNKEKKSAKTKRVIQKTNIGEKTDYKFCQFFSFLVSETESLNFN